MEEGLPDLNGNTITNMREAKTSPLLGMWCMTVKKTVTNPKPMQNQQNQTTINLELTSGLF